MSATILYHMPGIRGYTFLRQSIVPGGIEFYLAVAPTQLICPCCGSTNVWQKGSTTPRHIRSLPFGRKTTTIILEIPRVFCLDCKKTRQVHLTFAEEHKRYTRFFERYVLDLLLSMTCQDVAKHLGLSWDTVRDIEKRRLTRDFAKPDEKGAARLEKALSIHADLAVAHVLKEQLYELWEQEDEESGFQYLVDWIADAEWSEIPETKAFAKTLRNHWQEIVNYYCCEITSGPLEGLNNKIKTLKRQSYGFQDQEYFKLKILAIHQARYELLG